MTQKELVGKIPATIRFSTRGREGRGTLTYAARNQQYVIVETGKPEEPIYLTEEDLQSVREDGEGLVLELPEAVGAGPLDAKRPRRS